MTVEAENGEDKPLYDPHDERSWEWREKFNMAHWRACWIARNYWQGVDVYGRRWIRVGGKTYLMEKFLNTIARGVANGIYKI